MFLKISKKGFTLLECILAITISALVIASLSVAFKVSMKSWKTLSLRNEAVEQARMAIDKMARELRYADQLIACSWNNLEFQTQYLVDSDEESENIAYKSCNEMGHLCRSEGQGMSQQIAGSYSMGHVILEPTAYSVDPMGNLNEISMPPYTNAGAVKLQLTIHFNDPEMQDIIVTTLVALRNV